MKSPTNCALLRPSLCRWLCWCWVMKKCRSVVAGSPAITIDGCKLACAAKMVRQSGGMVAKEIAVLDVYRQHKDLKPLGIAELNEGGQKLAHVLAEEVSTLVDGILTGKQGGQNA